jgi:hypothetical protein
MEKSFRDLETKLQGSLDPSPLLEMTFLKFFKKFCDTQWVSREKKQLYDMGHFGKQKGVLFS